MELEVEAMFGNSLFWLSKGKHGKFFNGLCGKLSVNFRADGASYKVFV